MPYKNQWISILIVGMSLGTAWAIRGHFGHEQGAAWAGGIGALALVLVSRRKDWYQKMLSVALASAVGWGAGGMISYGIVVGYGRSDNFPNAFYGLSMLFVIGGLFGLLGGGLTGLALESSDQKKVKWSSLIAEMVAGGLIVYYLLVEQLWVLMTPPRSEAWAICLGAGLAMIWYMARNSFLSSLRVSLYSLLGAGFGFAFGNFLQTVGTVLEINFNMWNVMEYSIGFFGGSAMTFSVFTSKWPVPPIAFFDTSLFALKQEPMQALVVLIVVPIAGWLKVEKSKFSFGRIDVWFIFVVFFSMYIVSSYVVTGAFAGRFHLNNHLYIINLIVILLLLRKHLTSFSDDQVSQTNFKIWSQYLVAVIVVIVLLSIISISIHGEMSGSHDRFLIR